MTVSIPDTDSLSSLLAEDSTDKSFQQIGTIVRIWMRFLVVVAFVLGIAGCGVINLSGNEPLPAVPSLATPQLPDWIEEISP
ncbi:hypothetical protein H6F50_12670, partial [Coleofasciculus sp. FACHB-712]|uniref:hypothetical protein n=1 Tax=Coleofasciculus sp. FACHB-712 TaxID=2692789 RepID=UPI001681C430